MTANARFVPPARKEIADARLQRPVWSSAEPRDPRLLWLDKNENTDPIFQEVIIKALAGIDPRSVTAYPDTAPLYRRLGDYLGVSPKSLILASGSDGVIGAVFRTFVGSGDVVLMTDPTYAMYPVYAGIQGADVVRMEYAPGEDGPVLRPETVIESIRKHHPKLVCLPNPDSPTGNVFAPDALKNVVRAALEAGAMILVDEAYHPFYDHTVLPWIADFPNLIIARTFSKAWGLTGARLGYGVSTPEAAALMQKVRPNYDGNMIAAALALRLISDFEPDMRASVERLNRGRDGFIADMKALGFKALTGHGNFCHVAFGPHAGRAHAALSDLVLYRKDNEAPCLKGFSRFSATTAERFAPVVESIRDAVRRPC
ncbi:MAG: histidinol-phosphate aminotransferase family protein [Elusimicrobia bacterium]|nr:histidinol-phosphate aminotransferase family protein [Elusimicrobiota bacterium]